MSECRYCGRSFEDEEAYLEHLREQHAADLGPIDRRRAFGEEEGSGIDPGPVAILGVVGIAAAIVAYVVFFSGGGASADGMVTPHSVGSVHYHGTMEMAVAGDRVDFSRDAYQLQADPFHFEAGDGTRWHVHARSVTLEYAMSTLGIGVSGDSVTFQGTTYRDDDPDTTVVVEVNGESVDPREYVLADGDAIRIVVSTG